MTTTIRIVIGIVLLAGIVASALFTTSSSETALNASYILSGTKTALVDGKASEEVAPGSASRMVTEIFGKPATGDLNGDGKDDFAVVIQQSLGGTGTFYYVAAAITEGDGARGTNGILLGDRIAPQTLEIKDGTITANYADRKPDEPFSTPPSIGVTKLITLQGDILVEIQR